MALAITLGALSALCVSLIYFIVEYLNPTSPLRTFFDLVSYNYTSTLPSTSLYQQLSNDINRQMALFADPAAYLVGGIVMGETVSRRYSQRQVFLAGGGMAFALNLVALSIPWGMRLVSQHGHLQPGQIDPKLEAMQGLLTLFWIGMCLVGIEIGLRWRNAKLSGADAKTAPAAPSH
ncbi:hypothetical protein CCAX7_002330 [Capsulimonas corticalis]|uniref:Uncharacterized protein n=2 Tax=Capsulimonas corticalis TaxID=2219043 RepID=A0A402CS13_9BACT|nr:hypothetical protein CCAX7_002330 [Capsulimonas corticalis]